MECTAIGHLYKGTIGHLYNEKIIHLAKGKIRHMPDADTRFLRYTGVNIAIFAEMFAAKGWTSRTAEFWLGDRWVFLPHRSFSFWANIPACAGRPFDI